MGTYYVNEGHFLLLNREYSFLLIKLKSIRFGGNIRIWLLSGNRVLRIVIVLFPIGIAHRSAVTAMQLPSMSCTILCVFGSFASLSRHLAFIELVGKYRLATVIIQFEAPQREYAMYGMICYSAVYCSSEHAVAPVATH